MILLSCFNFISIIIWLYRLSPWHNFRYLQRRLIEPVSDEHADDSEEDQFRKQFVYRYLQGDGTFMLRLIVANVSDYVCRRITIELYRVFRQSFEKHTIGREPLFRPILVDQEHENNDLNASIDQRIKTDIPPIPNPRHGKVFVERTIFPRTSSFNQDDIDQSEPLQVDLNLEASDTPTKQIRFRSSAIPLLKDIRRSSEIQIDSSGSIISRYQNVESQLELEMKLPSPIASPVASTPPPVPPPPPPLKGPSPYATTYLPSRKRSEHELPYIDDSVSSGSTSGRLINTTVVQKAEKPKTLASTDIFFRRSHDV